MSRHWTTRLRDFILFPIRSLCLHERDRWWGTSLATERFEMVAPLLKGRCLDIGCGIFNRFITRYAPDGVGIDVFLYEGLTQENIVSDLTHLPFEDETFDSVTFIACLNHAPEPQRPLELREAWRVLRPGGNVIVTMATPLTEICAHAMSRFYTKVLPWYHDMDSDRGMVEGETYYVTTEGIRALLDDAGFIDLQRTYNACQWWLNSAFSARKPDARPQNESANGAETEGSRD